MAKKPGVERRRLNAPLPFRRLSRKGEQNTRFDRSATRGGEPRWTPPKGEEVRMHNVSFSFAKASGQCGIR